MPALLIPLAIASLLLSGAIFGFFFAWICSTIWGLDAADPRIAIAAMQAMNASVRNIVFAPAFFATPFVLFATAAIAYASARRRAAILFAMAGVLYLFGGMILTIAVNVPMNQELARIALPESLSLSDAQAIWHGYSPRWQLFNTLRTLASGGALLLVGAALLQIRTPEPGL